MNAIVPLSSDLNVITAEINSYKQVAGQSLFEIGKRLKHVRDEMQYGEYDRWCTNSLGFTRRTANRFIQSFEQFGIGTTSSQLDTSKIFEMLSLPESIDRTEFVEKQHTVPSTGETKTVDDMTVRELREVKKSLQLAERRANEASEQVAKAEQDARHWQGVARSAQNQPARIETKTVEVVPQSIKDEMETDKRNLRALKRELERMDEELNAVKLKNADDFDYEQAERERKKLELTANIETVKLRVVFKEFIEKAAISSYLYGAIAASDDAEKRRLDELIQMVEKVVHDTKLALTGRKIGEFE